MASIEKVPYVETEHMRDRVNHLANGLLSRLNEISISEYPNETPRQLVGLVNKIINKVKEYAAETSNTRLLSLMADLLKSYGVLLRYLDNANTEQTPRALTGMLEWMYAKLDLNQTLLACPQSVYNYSIVDLLDVLKVTSRNLLTNEDANKIFGNTPPINHISFPRIERDNILLHVIFGHEIGHPFADRYLSQEDIGDNNTVFQNQLKKVTELVDQEISKSLDPTRNFLKEVDIRQRLVGQVIEIRRKGLQELLSDAVSVQVFGPSAIFAAREIFMTSNFDTVPQTKPWYPPNRYRLRSMIQLARKLGQWDALKESAAQISGTLQHLENIVEQHSDMDEMSKEPFVHIAYKWLEEVLDDAVSYTLNLTRAAAYEPSKIRTEVPELLCRVPLNIPPSETGFATKPTPVDWRSSILSSWIYRYSRMGEDNFDAKKLLNITRKAVEHVFLREKFVKAQGS